MQKVVGITGSDGNVGTTLRRGLVDEYDLRFYTKEPVEYESTVADLSDAEQVKGIFDGVDCLIHLAAYIHASGSWDQILPNNIVATQNVFEEAVRAGVKKIVFASTNHTQHGYFMLDNNPNVTDPDTTERYKLSDPPFPDSLYGVSKLFGENLGRYYSKIADIQFVALKIGWTTVEDTPDAMDGKLNERHMRALFLSQRDCIEAFRKAIEIDTKFLVAYATGENEQFGIFDLTETNEKLGFHPQDTSDLKEG